MVLPQTIVEGNLQQIDPEHDIPDDAIVYMPYKVSVGEGEDATEEYLNGWCYFGQVREQLESKIQAKIDAALTAYHDITVVADIAARDAMSPETNIRVLVLDASDDPNVETGHAFYVWSVSGEVWVRTNGS